jgi:hypothetical protein
VPTALEISLVCGILVRWRALFEAILVDVVCVDVQVWLGLCGYHTRDHGRVYLVYCSYYFMAVRWSCFFCPVTFILTTSLYYVIRTQFRRQANSADNKAATVAVDSLLNYEAVKVRTRYSSRVECLEMII